MLNSTDLKSLKKLFRQEISSEVRNLNGNLMAEMKMSRMRIQGSINSLEDRIKNAEITQNQDSKNITKLGKNVNKLRKDLTSTINHFDNRNDSVKSALKKTRNELNLSELEFA